MNHGQRCNRVYSLLATLIVAQSSCISVERVEGKTVQKIKMERCSFPETKYSWNTAKPPKLIWLSIDSLNESGLNQILSKLKKPHPHGFKKLAEIRNRNSSMKVWEPTITASSHISTITCSSAATHGIFANFHFVDGKTSSGFSAPFKTETFATVLKNHGLKVVTGAYPSLDNSEPGRTVDEGFAYGDTFGQGKTYFLKKQNNQIEHVWSPVAEIESLRVRFSATGGEIANLDCSNATCSLQPAQKKKFWDLTFEVGDNRLRAYIQFLEGKDPAFYISPLTSNNAFPQRVKKQLNSCNYIFSPGKNSSLAKWGAADFIGGLEHRLSFFESVWQHYIPSTDADAIFLYLEDIDSIRHQYSGDDSVDEDVASHFERVDKLLGEFFASIPASTNVVVLGDHGMSTIKKDLNIRKILQNHGLDRIDIFTSGGTLMLFDKEKQTKNSATMPDADDIKWLRKIKKNLEEFRLPDDIKNVFRKVLIKGSNEMLVAGLSHPNAPFLMAFAHEDFSLQNSLSNELILADINNPASEPPRPRGQHGHSSDSPQMSSYLVGWGPILDSLDLKRVASNIDLVPALGQALGWPTPSQCRRGKIEEK